jgi:hypothetical protein
MVVTSRLGRVSSATLTEVLQIDSVRGRADRRPALFLNLVAVKYTSLSEYMRRLSAEMLIGLKRAPSTPEPDQRGSPSRRAGVPPAPGP